MKKQFKIDYDGVYSSIKKVDCDNGYDVLFTFSGAKRELKAHIKDHIANWRFALRQLNNIKTEADL